MRQLSAALVAAMLCGGANASIVFRAEPPGNIPASVPLIQVLPTPVSRDTLTRRAASFGLTSSPAFVKTPVGLAAQFVDPTNGITKVVHQNANGSDFFADLSKYMISQPGPAGPIADTDATIKANAFIGLHHPNLVKEGAFHRVMHLMEQSQDLSTGQVLPAVQSESIVGYTRAFAGIPVVGPGDYGRIHVANTGEVTGSQVVWRKLKNTGNSLSLLPYSAVQQTLIGLLNKQLGDGHEDAIITKVEFGYYSRPENQTQGWYHPCYLFYVSFHDAQLNQDTGGRIIPIPAVAPTLLREPLELVQQQPADGDPARITFKATPPTMPTAVPIYQVNPNVVNADTIQLRASALGFTLAHQGKTPRGMQATDSTGRIVLYQDVNGAEFFGHMDRMLEEKPGEATPITDAVASRLASDWVAKSGDMDPNELEPPTVQHLFHQTFDVIKQTPGLKTQDETIVTYKRRKQGPVGTAVTYIPVLGQGEYVEVHVDNMGNVTGHHRVWRNTQQTTMVAEIKPYADILQEFLRRMQSQMGDGSVIVADIQFGYFSRGEGFSQGYLQPCVLFDIQLPDPNGGQITGRRQVAIPASDLRLEPLEDRDALDNPMPGVDTRAADSVPIVYGDLNGDGKVDTADVVLAMQIAGGIETSLLPPARFAAGDVSPADKPDNAINVDDALRIARSIFGLDDISNG